MEKFSAEIVLRCSDGGSILEGELVTGSNLPPPPLPESREFVASIMAELGFEVMASDYTLSIVGTRQRFEAAFGLSLEQSSLLEASNNGKLEVPAGLAEFVDAILVPEKPILF